MRISSLQLKLERKIYFLNRRRLKVQLQLLLLIRPLLRNTPVRMGWTVWRVLQLLIRSLFEFMLRLRNLERTIMSRLILLLFCNICSRHLQQGFSGLIILLHLAPTHSRDYKPSFLSSLILVFPIFFDNYALEPHIRFQIILVHMVRNLDKSVRRFSRSVKSRARSDRIFLMFLVRSALELVRRFHVLALVLLSG